MILCLLSLVFLATLASNVQPANADSGSIYIRSDGSIDPPTASISSFDNVTYFFAEDINGSIIVERNNVVVDGENYTLRGGTGNENGISISNIENVTIENVKIENFLTGIAVLSSSEISVYGASLKNNTARALWFDGSLDNNLTGNIILGNGYGISMRNSNSTAICSNVIASNENTGVSLLMCTGNNISLNSIETNYMGMGLTRAMENTISGNSVRDNSLEGVGLWEAADNIICGNTFIDDGLGIWSWTNNTVYDNTVNGKPLVHLLGASNQSIDAAGQVILAFCRDITVKDLVLSNTSIGVHLVRDCNISVVRCAINANRWGVVSYGSFNNSIVECAIENNKYTGIVLGDADSNIVVKNKIAGNGGGLSIGSFSDGNLLHGNNVSDNGIGIRVFSSVGNVLSYNNFMNNTHQAFCRNSSDIWDNSYPSGGNYWSDYPGIDIKNGPYQNETGFDWIGDSAYTIDENNTDRYPLARPFVAETEEVHTAYRCLLLRFSQTSYQLDSLNSTIAGLSKELASTQTQVDSLNGTVAALSTDIQSLNAAIASLQQQTMNLNTTLDSTRSELSAEINSLDVHVSDLQERLDSLNSTLQSSTNTQQSNYNSLTNQLNTILNVTYALTATVTILVLVVAYFAIRKPKTKPATTLET